MSGMHDEASFADLPILGELRDQLQLEFESRLARQAPAPRRWLPRHIRIATALAGAAVLTGSATAAVVTLFGDEPPLSPGAVILARGQGPNGSSYELAVAPSKCPGWVRVEKRSSTGYSYGGCGQPLHVTLAPRVSSGDGGADWEELEGTVSSAAHSVRVVLAGGGSITAPVYPIPANIAKGAGVFLLFADRSIEHALRFQSLDAQGRVLASGPPPPDSFSHPVTSLAPGVLTVARGRTPHGTPFEIGLQRIRFMGKLNLCLSEMPQGNSQCPPYPVRERTPIFLLQAGEGSCLPPRYQLLAGLLLRPGLTAWLHTPGRMKQLKLAAVPSSFRVPGGVFYGILTRGPARLVIRNQHGVSVYSTSVLRPAETSSCSGLDPATSDGS
jgi:hypothetical protein